MDGHDYFLRFDVIGGLPFSHLAPLVTPPPFSIGCAFDIGRIIETRKLKRYYGPGSNYFEEKFLAP
jgi:hypothetical protein